MPIELKIPEVGESITEVQIAEWLKAEGDAVQKDEPLVVIDSEKTTLELPAPESGTLAKILHPAGATVGVGEVIARLEPGGEQTEKTTSSPVANAGERRKTNTKKTASPVVPNDESNAPTEAKDGKTESPKNRTANQLTSTKSDRAENAEPKPAQPTSEQPKITAASETESDEPEAAAPAKEETKPSSKPSGDSRKVSSRAADGEEEVVPMTMLRRTVARRLVEAKQQMAMLTTFNEVDMSAVKALRHEHQEAFEQRHQVKLGLMSFFVKAAVDALKQFPQLNAEVRGNDIVYRNYFNIGVAIATGRGLVVPALRHAELLSFAEVEKAIGDFAGRAKDGKLKPDELDGATFTITNGGVFGSLLSTPIINPPQSGILGLHTIQDRPIAVDGQVIIRPMMYLALTYDHRIVDGREAVLFIRRIKEAVESPARMLLEI